MFYVIYPELWQFSVKKIGVLEFTTKEVADPLMSVAVPLWFCKFREKISKFWNFLQILKIMENFGKFRIIYPSQRQNLLPTLEILIQNFENFQIFKILEKKFPNSEFFLKISKTTEGPPMTSKGPPPPY